MAQPAEVKCAEEFGVHNSSYYSVTGNVVKSLDGNHGCVYGSKSVNSGCHEWLIKYENTGNRCCGGIGIASHSNQQSRWCADKTVTICFYHQKSGSSKSYINLNSCKSPNVNTKLQSGDTVRILLNYEKKTVEFLDKNDTKIFSVDNLPIGQDISYRVYVDGDGRDDKYTILKSEGGADIIKISLEKVSTALSAVNEALQKANEGIKKLKLEQLVKMKQETAGFLDECKEFEQNFENTKKEVQLLGQNIDKEMNPDTNNYKSWNIEQICRYVLSLENQRFAKYVNALQAALEKQQIGGADLPEIEANDLYTMGIDNFKDRKSLAKYFRNLDTNEGDIATEHH